MTIAAVGLVRVSTDEQSLSLEIQRAKIEAYCAEREWPLLAIYEDEDVCGATPLDKRPGLLAALTGAPKGGVLLVAKRDRLARDPIICAMAEAALRRKGARVVSLAGEGTDGDGPSDVLMRRIVDAFAEYERLIIGARTKAAMQRLKETGRTTGNAPYGWRAGPDGTLVVDAEERAAINFARVCASSGYPLRVIATYLTARGHLSRNGRPFSHTAIAAMLKTR